MAIITILALLIFFLCAMGQALRTEKVANSPSNLPEKASRAEHKLSYLEAEYGIIAGEKRRLKADLATSAARIRQLEEKLRDVDPAEVVASSVLDIIAKGDGLNIVTGLAEMFRLAQADCAAWKKNPNSRLNHQKIDTLLKVFGLARRSREEALKKTLAEYEDDVDNMSGAV